MVTLSIAQTVMSLQFVRRALTKIHEAAPQAFDSELVALTYSSESGAVARLQMALISEGRVFAQRSAVWVITRTKQPTWPPATVSWSIRLKQR